MLSATRRPWGPLAAVALLLAAAPAFPAVAHIVAEVRDKKARRRALAERALAAIDEIIAQQCDMPSEARR